MYAYSEVRSPPRRRPKLRSYEHQLPGNFFFPTYYGEGMRLAFTARADLSSHLRLHARLGYTNYFDRSTIGTGLQQISASHLTDIDLQLRWRF